MHLFFIILFFSSSAFALELNDKIKTNILKIYERNILVINRGLEDGIEVKDHAKITSDDGFIARGFCVKTGMMTSHWKIYRVVHPELVSKDTLYDLRSLKTSAVDPNLAEDQEKDYSDDFPDWDEKNLDKSIKLQQDRVTNFDLPIDTKKDPIVLNAQKTDTQQFMDRNFDAQQFAEDFSQYQATIFAAPIQKQTLNHQEDINYGFQLANQGQKYELQMNYNEMQSKSVNPLDKAVVSSKNTTANMNFDINRIFPKLSYFMFINYEQSRYGEVFTPRKHLQGGILGLKYHIYEGETLRKFDISYITLLDQREDDVQEYITDPLTGAQSIHISQTKTTNVRHSFRVRALVTFTENFSFTETLWWRPYMLLDTKEVDFNDVNMQNIAKLIYRFSENISTSFTHTYTYDIVQYRLNNIPAHNNITSLELNYSFVF